jgi:putrescine transport system ATP-binding protein
MASARPDQKNEPWKDPGTQPYVRLDKLTKKFGDFVAVDDVSLNIYRGEIFCLLGGSGSGKTTLLRLMAGFEAPTEGTIWIDGVDVTATPPYERPINMMFQSYALFPHMSVQKNVAFGLRQDKVAKSEIEDRVAEILKLVRMEQLASACRTSSPAASASASRSRAPSSSGRSSCCSTSPLPRSTASSASIRSSSC